jgi:ATP-binding cassette subfamily B protein
MLPQKLSPLRELAPFLRPYRWRIAFAFTALLVAAAATMAVPLAFRQLIDIGFSGSSRVGVDAAFVTLLAVATALAAATAARYYAVSWLGERVTADIRGAVFDNVLRQSPRFFETLKTGEVLSRLTSDTTLVETVVGTSFSLGLRNLFLLCGGLLMLAVTSPLLTAYIVLVLVAVVAPIIVFGRRVRRLSRSTQDRMAEASARAGETLGAITTVQAYTREPYESGRFRDTVETVFIAALRRVRARALLTLAAILLIFGSVVGVLWLGAQDVLAGRMSIGTLGAFILYALLCAGALGGLAEVWGDLQRAAGAVERLLELQRAVPTIVSPARPRPLAARKAAIAFEDVSFSYPSRPDAPVLHAFNLRVRPGETAALVGPSGAGKSTVFQLLLRFQDPQQGRISIDGVNIREVLLNDLRGMIGIVPQEPTLFSTDALENIRYGRAGATDAEVREAARLAFADEFIERLPQGYATFLGERGVRLSGGQRQRIAIARALLKDPPILLLDEATSALDAESESKVQAAIENATRDRTVLVIAHRLATVARANRIVLMDHGAILAVGNHQELMAASPLYARLAQLQFMLEP